MFVSVYYYFFPAVLFINNVSKERVTELWTNFMHGFEDEATAPTRTQTHIHTHIN